MSVAKSSTGSFSVQIDANDYAKLAFALQGMGRSADAALNGGVNDALRFGKEKIVKSLQARYVATKWMRALEWRTKVKKATKKSGLMNGAIVFRSIQPDIKEFSYTPSKTPTRLYFGNRGKRGRLKWMSPGFQRSGPRAMAFDFRSDKRGDLGGLVGSHTYSRSGGLFPGAGKRILFTRNFKYRNAFDTKVTQVKGHHEPVYNAFVVTFKSGHTTMAFRSKTEKYAKYGKYANRYRVKALLGSSDAVLAASEKAGYPKHDEAVGSVFILSVQQRLDLALEKKGAPRVYLGDFNPF